MRWMNLLGLWLVALCPVVMAVPEAKSVAVLYNTEEAESKKLAEFYIQSRGIPKENLIGLKMPAAQEITRQQYDDSIAEPLREVFTKRGWWKRAKDAKGITVPMANQIRVLVTVRGVPLKIKQSPKPAVEGQPANNHPFNGRDEASVDSELAMVGAEGMPVDGALKNAYYKSNKEINGQSFPVIMLTARIDAPTYETCERMIRDAIAVEKTGLWGMAYVDIANKFPMGDKWLEDIVKENLKLGIPTVVDRFNDTLPTNYPMSQAAMYYGWYDWNLSGPFVNPDFRFRKGAVAMHLHSFSAQQLRNPKQNWSGGLLESGAAVTIGNVYEPYLHMSHDFALLHRALLDGYSWVEACWMATPVVSWQGVVLGDPLYQPFRHVRGTGDIADEDIEYRALRAAAMKWQSEPDEKVDQLEAAASRMKSGTILETLGLELRERGRVDDAKVQFQKAATFYEDPADKLRQEFHLITIDRQANRKREAITALKAAKQRYAGIPEIKSVLGWLDILNPPPPPPADPRQVPAKPSNP